MMKHSLPKEIISLYLELNGVSIYQIMSSIEKYD